MKERWIEPFENTTGGSRLDLEVDSFFVTFGVSEFLNSSLSP